MDAQAPSVLEMREVYAEGRRADTMTTIPMMQSMRPCDHAEEGRPSNERRYPETPVRHTVVCDDVGTDVERAADAEPDEHWTAERDE